MGAKSARARLQRFNVDVHFCHRVVSLDLDRVLPDMGCMERLAMGPKRWEMGEMEQRPLEECMAKSRFLEEEERERCRKEAGG